MQLGKKIKALREGLGLSQTDLANKTGLHRSQLSSMENENIPPFQDFTKYKLLGEILKTNPHELWEMGQRDREEWKAKQHLVKASLLRPDIAKKPTRPIPILSEIPADTPREVTDQDYPPGIAEDYYEFKVNDPSAFFLRVEGDCMSPEIKKGDLLLISPNDKVENGDIAVVVNKKGEKEVRRVTIQPDQIVLSADNPVYPVRVWRKEDEPKIIGRVKEIIRRR